MFSINEASFKSTLQLSQFVHKTLDSPSFAYLLNSVGNPCPWEERLNLKNDYWMKGWLVLGSGRGRVVGRQCLLLKRIAASSRTDKREKVGDGAAAIASTGTNGRGKGGC